MITVLEHKKNFFWISVHWFVDFWYHITSILSTDTIFMNRQNRSDWKLIYYQGTPLDRQSSWIVRWLRLKADLLSRDAARQTIFMNRHWFVRLKADLLSRDAARRYQPNLQYWSTVLVKGPSCNNFLWLSSWISSSSELFTPNFTGSESIISAIYLTKTDLDAMYYNTIIECKLCVHGYHWWFNGVLGYHDAHGYMYKFMILKVET